MIKLSLRRPVTVSMFVLFVIVLGVISYSKLGRDLLPDIAFPSLTVMTSYEGAAPQEVEEFITKRLETGLATVKGKRRISSISREGLSLITIEFEWGQDMQIATLNVREKLDVTRFQAGYPEDAERPNILRWDPSSKPIVGLAITGGTAPILQVKEGVREVIKPRLEQLDGVAFAQISGDIERVIDVEVDREKLVLYNLDLNTLARAIDNANANIAGGTIKKGRYRYTLRTLGEFISVDEINSVIVDRKDGADIRISDVAVVHDTTKDRDAMATVNGKEAIGLLVYKEAGSNTIEATRKIKELIAELSGPRSDYQITLAFEEAKFIEQALNNVWVSLLFGGMFAFVVLVLFLSDLKSPLFIFVSIPIAIITTLSLMWSCNLSLNIMSLGGLALGVGMLVDNSIVVLENIYRYRESGESPLQAAWMGAREVAMPVFASTLTTVAVFFPIIYLEGVTGALFGEQALTVTFSLFSSLLVSLTVLPLLTATATILEGRDTLPATMASMPKMEAATYPRGFLFWKWWELLIAVLVVFAVAGYFKIQWDKSLMLVAGVVFFPLVLFALKWVLTYLLAWTFQVIAFFLAGGQGLIQRLLDRLIIPIFEFFYRTFEHAYHAVLDWALDHKLPTLAMAIVLMAVTVLAAMDLKMELMPKSATGQFTVDLKLEPGTSLEDTAIVISSFEKMLTEDPAVEIVFSQLGSSEANVAQLLQDSGTNTAQISVKLVEESVSLEEVYRLSEMVRAEVRSYPGMKVTFTESESSFEDLLASEGTGLVVKLSGERMDELYLANTMVIDALRGIEGLKDVKTTMRKDHPQIKIDLNRENIARYGFDLSTVGNFLAGGMRGEQATQYKEFDRQIDVRVRFSENDRANFEDVMTTTLTSADGTPVPLSELMDVKSVKDTKEIRRINQKRVALISANPSGKKISEVTPEVKAALATLVLPKGVSKPEITGEQEGINNSFQQLGLAFILSALLVYMIMAGQFESLRFPFVVIFTLPMGLVGTVFMLYTFNQSVNIMSLIGLIVLSGIVVNDAIVKVDFINQSRREGMALREAILKASRVRLRPILMTTATTVLGLLPMATGWIPKLMGLPFMARIVSFLDVQTASLGFIKLSELFSPRGAEIQRPLALVVIGGLSLATLLTLIFIPVLYEMMAGEVVAETESSQQQPPATDLVTEEDPA